MADKGTAALWTETRIGATPITRASWRFPDAVDIALQPGNIAAHERDEAQHQAGIGLRSSLHRLRRDRAPGTLFRRGGWIRHAGLAADRNRARRPEAVRVFPLARRFHRRAGRERD